MNAMWQPSSAAARSSCESCAAVRPTSGFAPAPSPAVTFIPSCSFRGGVAVDIASACASVFATTNSHPVRLWAIMLLTAFEPAPPTPTTAIRGCRNVSIGVGAGAGAVRIAGARFTTSSSDGSRSGAGEEAECAFIPFSSSRRPRTRRTRARRASDATLSAT